MNSSRIKAILRSLACGSAMGALLIGAWPRPALAIEPGTVVLAAQTVQMILSAGRRVPDLATMNDQVLLETLVETHRRLDAIEATLAAIHKKVALLPEITRRYIAEGHDQAMVSDLRGAMDTAAEILEGFGSDSPEARRALYDLRVKRNTLFQRNSLAAPVLLEAFAFEHDFCRALTCANWSATANVYRRGFAGMFDPEQDGSLARSYRDLVAEQEASGARIMSIVSRRADVALGPGTFHWFNYTIANRKKEALAPCKIPTVVNFPVPLFPISSCPPPVDVDADIVIHRWSRSIEVAVLDDVTPARRITLSKEVARERRDRQDHRDPIIPDSYDRSEEAAKQWASSFDTAHERLLADVEEYNARAEYLMDLSHALTMVRIAHAMTAAGEGEIEEALAELSAPELIGRRAAISERRSRRDVEIFSTAMANARSDAWERIEDGLTQLEEARAEVAKDAWRQQVVGALDLMIHTVRVVQAYNVEVARREYEAQRVAAVAAAAGTLARPSPAPAPPVDQAQPSAPAEPVAPAVESPAAEARGATAADRASEPVGPLRTDLERITMLNHYGRTSHVRKIMAEMGPLDPQSEEYGAQAVLALSILYTMEAEDLETGSMPPNSDLQVALEVIGELANHAIKGSTSLSAFLAASTPTHLGDPGLSLERNIRRAELTARLAEHLGMDRLPEGVDNEAIEVMAEQAERCRQHGCYRVLWP